jgi:uncharacterized membrane protein YbhN (UPF0104 family)
MNFINRAWASGAVFVMDDPLSGGDSVAIPGLARFKGLVSALVPFALVACVLTVIVGAIIWAMGGFTNNPHRATSGKSTVLWSLVAAIVIGAAGFAVGWAHDQGTTIS